MTDQQQQERGSRFFITSSAGRFKYPQNGMFSYKIKPRIWDPTTRTSLVEIVEAVRVDNPQNISVDWKEVNRLMNGKFPDKGYKPMECFLHYKNVADPKINAKDWTLEEERRLLTLVQKHGLHEWWTVAAELGTNRTTFECLSHYQRGLNSKLTIESEWTPEEIALLLKGVDAYPNWKEVSDTIPGRTTAQCSKRWQCIKEKNEVLYEC